MTLKSKLIISFCSIILLPSFLLFVFGYALIQMQIMSIEYQYGVEVQVKDFVSNNTHLFDQIISKMQIEFEEKMQENPELLEDEAALKIYCDELARANVELMVFYGDELFYETGDWYEMLENEIQERFLTEMAPTESFYIGEHSMMVYPVCKERLEQGTECSIYATVCVKQWIPQLKAFMVQSMVSLMFILLLTAMFFTMWIYRSVVRPLGVLKEAAGKIKDGNLDFQIKADENNEMGQLCCDFEQMRQRLKESAEEKVQFDLESKELISNISHDLKTPITAIKGYVEGIIDGVADTPEKLDRYVRTIYNKAIEMDRLINELTFYSKIDTNRIPYNFNKLCLRDYFLDCAEELEMELESKNIHFQFANYVNEDTFIIADPEQLRRVINNIVSNSVKYFDKERMYINMRIKDAGDFIQVEIEDNGKGIGQKDLQYIFERFYRTDSSRNSAKGGSGIGLSIVKKIIEDHGGKIWANSREGTGTVMIFVLRKYQETVAQEPEQTEEKQEQAVGKIGKVKR